MLACRLPAGAYREIHPRVKATRAGVEVINQESFTYPKARITVVGEDGFYSKEVGDIIAGQTVRLDFKEFVGGNGDEPFDIKKMKLKYITVKVWFDGQLSYQSYEVH